MRAARLRRGARARALLDEQVRAPPGPRFLELLEQPLCLARRLPVVRQRHHEAPLLGDARLAERHVPPRSLERVVDTRVHEPPPVPG